MADPYRVLIVEDERDQAELVMEFLRISGPFRVEWVKTVQGLWNSLTSVSQGFDILLIDYRLPDGTGLGVLEELSKRGYQIPVVMITGQGDERLAVRALQLGAVDYLVKGSDYLSTLPTVIQKAIRAHDLQRFVQSSLEQVRYQALLLNNVRDAVVVWNTEGEITYWNPAAAMLFGWSPKECLGQSVEERYMKAFSPPVRTPPSEGTSGHEVERRYITRDGRLIWVSSRVSALRDFGANGKLIGFMDVSRDITERKKAKDALRAERNFVSTVLDTVGALVIVLDDRGRIVRFNRACEQITGYTFKEVKDKIVWDLFIIPEEVDEIKALYNNLLAGNFPNEYENQWVTRDGSRRLISWANTALVDTKNQVKYIIATGIDITERKQTEHALRESEARYRAVSELVSDYIYALRIEPEGRVTCDWMTDGFARITDFAALELDWREHWTEIVHPDDHSLALQIVQHLQKNKTHVCELRILTQDGEIRWLRNYARPLWSEEENRIIRVYGAAKDITERKRMEAQIQAAQTRLTQSARLAAIGELASGVAHHINNPLTTIIAEAQILLQSLPPQHNGRESAEDIEQAGWRVQKAVQQLLDFSQPTSDTLEDLSVNATIESALALIGDQIHSSGVNLAVDLCENLPPIRGNAHQLGDLWFNLLMLARDATADGHSHTIGIRSRTTTDGSILVEVSDDGKLIPAEEMATLFEPNFIKPIGGRGTGIELNICQEIVRQYQGQITAQSTPEQGTIFRVSIPVEV